MRGSEKKSRMTICAGSEHVGPRQGTATDENDDGMKIKKVEGDNKIDENCTKRASK